MLRMFRREFSKFANSTCEREQAFNNFVALANNVSTAVSGGLLSVKDGDEFRKLDKTMQAKMFFWSIEENEETYRECSKNVIFNPKDVTKIELAIDAAKQAYEKFINIDLEVNAVDQKTHKIKI